MEQNAFEFERHPGGGFKWSIRGKIALTIVAVVVLVAISAGIVSF